ncbi:hypothetical protein BDB00DRAFT_823605 [Zychaea mexicana]|uniref:uncharacterized protein n=1 Tax=Zychaea mexicana TaxID=64656 RepID=UPI0022FDEBA7|nr:uncharacterized protein BDB00DRAFT_823605 [Zychaea mexicana]KAI9493340.1 hypothetical protein BDB00DRAFT_823605 [Zychaea mexicana]
MFKYGRKKRQDEKEQLEEEEEEEAAAAGIASSAAPPLPPPKDISPAVTSTTSATIYKPLDEIDLPRDFRASLIVTQFNPDPPTDLSVPQDGKSDTERLSTLPMPSMPWMTAGSTDSTRPPLSTMTASKPTPSTTTPPLSPTSSSSASDTLVRKSSSTRSSNEPWRPPLLLGSGGRQMNKGDDFQDIATGPPIIPRSKTPPPLPIMQPIALNHHHNNNNSKGKTIFDSDDDDEASDNDPFFLDFSAGRPRSKCISKKSMAPTRDAKTQRISRFDLSAFANHLHENRLSMMQLRQTVHLSEEDEKELMQLLEKRKSMAPTRESHSDTAADVQDQFVESSSSDELRPPVPLLVPPQRPVSKKPSLLLQKLKGSSHSAAKELDPVEPTPSLSAEQQQQQAERKRRVRKSMSMDEIHRMTTAKKDEKTLVSEAPTVPSIQEVDVSNKKTLAPSTSTPSLMAPWNMHKSSSSSSTRKLASFTSNNNNNNNYDDASKSSSASDTPKPQRTASTTPGQKAIGLFGSLRQASRSHQPFRGLVRNLSSAGSYYRARHSSANGTVETGGMSRAAMAVMEHQQGNNNTSHSSSVGTRTPSKDAKTKLTATTTMTSSMSTTATATTNTNAPFTTAAEDHGEGSGGGNLLTTLLAKASKSSKRTKTVNMNHHNSSANSSSSRRREKTKSRVVRRTIIYVPPDSLNFMKTLQQQGGGDDISAGLRKKGPAPPLPPDMLEKMRQLQKSPSSKPTSRKPTLLSRHSEIEKDDADLSTGSSSSRSSKQQDDNDNTRASTVGTQEEDATDDLGSILNYYDDGSLYDYYQSRDSPTVPQLEGLELREMSDGTVEWGIVKKQGNRKSFYVHDNKRRDVEEEEEEEEDEEKIEEQVLALMGLGVHGDASKQSLAPSTTTTTTTTSPPPVPRRSPRRRIDSAEQQMQQQQQQHVDNHRAKHISTIHSRKDASTTDVYFAPQQTLPSLLQMIADSAQEEEQQQQQAKRKKQASVEEQLDEMMRSFQPPVEPTKF